MSDDPISAFSDVDAAGTPGALVEYLDRAAAMLAERRRLRYPLLGLHVGDSVLDAGCGAGEVCADLRELVGPTGSVVGVDASSVMVETARSRVADADFEVADITMLPFEDETFHAVRSERVLQHVGEAQRAVVQLARVVRPGGRVVLVDPDHFQADVATDDHGVWAAIVATGNAAVANPQAGLFLREWMVTAGLDVIELIAAPLDLDWESFRAMHRLDRVIAQAVDGGVIDAADGARFVAEQEARAAAGTFCAVGVGYAAVGAKR